MDTVDTPSSIVPALSPELLAELQRVHKGQTYTKGTAKFKEHTTIFNGNVVTPAKAVVLPKDAKDVSAVVRFCSNHKLTISVKSGGYGTAGWAVNGDIVIVLKLLDGVEIEEPGIDGNYVPLTDMLPPGSKGKDRAKSTGRSSSIAVSVLSSPGQPGTGSQKRERSPDPYVVLGLPRNAQVAEFLAQTQSNSFDLPPPTVRRRIDPEGHFHPSRLPIERTVLRARQSEEAPTDHSGLDHSTSSNGDRQELPATLEGAAFTRVIGEHAGATGSQLQSQDPFPPDESHRIPGSTEANMSTVHTPTTRHPHVSTAPPHTSSNSGLRSEDPFSYLSSSSSSSIPSSSSLPRNTASYVQPAYPFSLPGPSHSTYISPPSNQANDASQHSLSELAADTSSPIPYLTSAAVPLNPHAYVTFGAGVNQKTIDCYSDDNRLPAKSPDGSTCHVAYHIPLAAHPVGSSVMILGGFGFLSRLYGLSIDVLVEAEVVLADGSILIVNAKQHPDLWWAIRGAGPAFGIVTRYKALAYPVPVVFAGNLIYNFHPATAASLLKHFRDCIKNAPRELYANVLFTAGPAGKGSLAVVQICYIGPKEKGQEFLQAISSWDGEPCLLNEVSEKTFLSQQDSVAQILRGKSGRQWFIRSALITSLPDEVIHKSVMEFANTPIGCTWLFELAGGAVADTDDTCVPKAQREAGFTVVAFHQWDLDDDDPLCVSTAEHWIYETLAPVACGGPYPAFFGRHETANRIFGAYGEENWGRLREIKKKYDPTNVFRNTFWPLGTDGNEVEPRSHEPPSP